MQTVYLETKEAPNKKWAAMDAATRNSNNKSHWSAKHQLRAERVLSVMDLLYSVERSYISYGKKQISVKLDAARVKDAKNLALLEAEYAMEGITKKVSPQGTIYVIK